MYYIYIYYIYIHQNCRPFQLVNLKILRFYLYTNTRRISLMDIVSQKAEEGITKRRAPSAHSLFCKPFQVENHALRLHFQATKHNKTICATCAGKRWQGCVWTFSTSQRRSIASWAKAAKAQLFCLAGQVLGNLWLALSSRLLLHCAAY